MIKIQERDREVVTRSRIKVEEYITGDGRHFTDKAEAERYEAVLESLKFRKLNIEAWPGTEILEAVDLTDANLDCYKDVIRHATRDIDKRRGWQLYLCNTDGDYDDYYHMDLERFKNEVQARQKDLTDMLARVLAAVMETP